MEPLGGRRCLLLCVLLPFLIFSGSVWGKSHKSVAPAPSEASPVGAPAPAASDEPLQAPSPSKSNPDIEAAISTARELGMPRLATYLEKMKARIAGNAADAPSEMPAPAPEPTKKKSARQPPAAAPAPEGKKNSAEKDPYFKGKPLGRTEADEKLYKRMKEEKKKAEADGKAAPIAFPIIYLDQLYNVNDLEADEIFSRGTAEIPSDIAKRASLPGSFSHL
jgi:hypothetical protein